MAFDLAKELKAAKAGATIVLPPGETVVKEPLNNRGDCGKGCSITGSDATSTIVVQHSRLGYPVLDCTDMKWGELSFRMKVHPGSALPSAGILHGRSVEGVGPHHLRMRDLCVVGRFSAAGVYLLGAELDRLDNVRVENWHAGGSAMRVYRYNHDNLTSPFGPLPAKASSADHVLTAANVTLGVYACTGQEIPLILGSKITTALFHGLSLSVKRSKNSLGGWCAVQLGHNQTPDEFLKNVQFAGGNWEVGGAQKCVVQVASPAYDVALEHLHVLHAPGVPLVSGVRDHGLQTRDCQFETA